MSFLGYAFLFVLTLFVVGLVSQALWDATRAERERRDDE